MDGLKPQWLGAAEAARAIARGELTSEELVRSCLARIREAEPQVQAWQYLDEEHALRQACARDADRAEGRACGPLHGVPVGIKDIIDTGDMPTEDGTVLHAGRIPDEDASVIVSLRRAGAVILGKTVTTELATYSPGKTRNPHDASRTPGGSSSGSAAAVACGMVPVALGTQTNGSMIRPAAFCGVVGYKPTHGWVPRHGILKLSRTLDTVGLFGRSLEDVALVAEQLIGFDANDPDTSMRARPPLVAGVAQEPPLPPKLALVKTHLWDDADPALREAFGELREVLGDACEAYDLPDSARAAWDWHRTIMEAEMAANLDVEWQRGRDKLSAHLQEQLARGREVKALAYQQAVASARRLAEGFDDLFDRYDAILTPSAPGTAPPIASTGDPSFCTLWSLAGMPACNLPLMTGPDGLPLGVQLVGRRHGDARLLRTAAWLTKYVAT
ncbi:MAG: amidase [Burkholderiales bacterium]|nr:amidase [Burkholderiales bacterium]